MTTPPPDDSTPHPDDEALALELVQRKDDVALDKCGRPLTPGERARALARALALIRLARKNGFPMGRPNPPRPY